MPRHIKIGLIVLAIGFVITFGLFVNVIGRIQSIVQNDSEENPFVPPQAPLYLPTDPPMTVKVFFPARGGDLVLATEDQVVFRSGELTNRVKQIVQKVIDGPQSPPLLPSIPANTKLLEVFVDDTGLAYLDFSSTLETDHPGGMRNEQATVYSIVNSLMYNLPEIRQVKILIGGAERETLAGHCLLLPMEMDLSITNVRPREEFRADEN